MATYTQWCSLFYEKKETKRLTYLVGPDRILVEEIVDAIRDRVAPHELDYASVSPVEQPAPQIWAAMNQYPIDPDGRRLVIVRDVEKLKGWDKNFQSWMASRHLPDVIVVMVDSRHEVDTKSEHMASIVKSGRYVSCGPLNEADAYAFISSKCAIDKSDALALLTRVGGDLAKAAGVASKAAVLGRRLDLKAIEILATPSPSEEFEDALIALNKPLALRAASDMDPSDYSRAIGSLDYRLDQVRRLNILIRRQTSMRDIIANSKIPPFVVKRLMPVAKHYDRANALSRTSALALVDSALRSGAREGLLEVLVATW
jgi:hypothetical protein